MSIHRRPDRPDRSWQVRWREEGRNRSRSFRTRREAVVFEASVDRQPERAPVTLEQWLARWFDAFGPGWAASTREQRARVCDLHIAPYLGAARLSELTRGRLRDWRRDLLLAGRTPNTVNSASRVLSAALTAAADEGLILANPMLGLRSVPVGPSDRPPVPLGIVQRLLAAVPQPRDRRAIALMAYAGLRPGEVRALRWSDVGDRTVWVARAFGVDGIKATKSASQGRSIQIRPALAAELVGPPVLELVAPGDRGGVLDWHNWSTRVWRPACEAVGAKGYVPYSLRHTYASLRIAEGASIVQVAYEMGHANPTTTLRHYARLLGEAGAPAA